MLWTQTLVLLKLQDLVQAALGFSKQGQTFQVLKQEKVALGQWRKPFGWEHSKQGPWVLKWDLELENQHFLLWIQDQGVWAQTQLAQNQEDFPRQSPPTRPK